jgi:hypothetical protein
MNGFWIAVLSILVGMSPFIVIGLVFFVRVFWGAFRMAAALAEDPFTLIEQFKETAGTDKSEESWRGAEKMNSFFHAAAAEGFSCSKNGVILYKKRECGRIQCFGGKIALKMDTEKISLLFGCISYSVGDPAAVGPILRELDIEVGAYALKQK